MIGERRSAKMKKLLLIIIILIIAHIAAPAQFIPPHTWVEADGSPKWVNPTKIIFPNGSVSRVGGTLTMLLVGGGGTGATNRVAVWSNTFSLTSDADLIFDGDNLGIGTSTFGASGTRVLALANGVPPATSPVDSIQLYAADSAAGSSELWVRNEAGSVIQMTGLASLLAADQTSVSTSLANLNLARDVQSGRAYLIRLTLYANEVTANNGLVIDFGGGTATATYFRVHCLLHDTSLVFSSQVVALTTVLSAGTLTGDSKMECTGALVVNAGGTLIPRFAKQSHTTGNLTIYRGSSIILSPAN